MKRRSILKSMAVAPIAILTSKVAFAKDEKAPANALDSSHPLAGPMKYFANGEEAAKNPQSKALYKAGRNCLNCDKYNKCAPADKACKPVSDAKAAYAPCSIFSGKVVKGTGWCMSWQKKA